VTAGDGGGGGDVVGVGRNVTTAEYTWARAQGLTGRCCYPVLEVQGVLPQGHETGAFCGAVRSGAERCGAERGPGGETPRARLAMAYYCIDKDAHVSRPVSLRKAAGTVLL